MSRYNELKYLHETKARKNHRCANCGESIESGDTYYRETLPMMKPPNVDLHAYCSRCYEIHGDGLIMKQK